VNQDGLTVLNDSILAALSRKSVVIDRDSGNERQLLGLFSQKRFDVGDIYLAEVSTGIELESHRVIARIEPVMETFNFPEPRDR